uniref:Polynucleotide 5'-hydroxyl-kinase NOL9 n=3 Tax=Schistocephalus solidus TaxID=70667 RepID=A0A0X3PDL3_SCHSO
MSHVDVSFAAGSCFIEASSHENRLWLCVLEPGSRWIIYGRVSVTYVLGDGALIFGAGLYSNELRTFDLFSPFTHTPLDLSVSLGSTILNQFPTDELQSRLSKVFGPESESLLLTVIEKLKGVTDKISPLSSVFLFKPLKSRVCDSIEEVRRFRDIFSIEPILKFSKSLAVAGAGFALESASSLDDRSFLGFRESEEMKLSTSKVVFRATVDDTKPLRILLCGPKNVGKSTYMRYLVNRLVTSTTKEAVAVLDCDIGQTELTPAGMMSLTLISKPLLGPPFTHPLGNSSRRVRQCFFGDLTPATNPTFYVQCLQYVFDAYKQLELLNYPLLINTMGWTQGLGLTLLAEQISITKPNIILQLYQRGRQAHVKQNLPSMTVETVRSIRGWPSRDLSTESFDYELFLIPSAAQSPMGANGLPRGRFDFGAPDHRDLTFLGHLLSELADAPTSLPGSGPNGRPHLGHPASHLLDCIPYHVHLAHPLGRAESVKPSANKRSKNDEPSAEDLPLPADTDAATDSRTEKSTEDGVKIGLEEDDDDEEPWALAVHILHPPVGVFESKNRKSGEFAVNVSNSSLYDLSTIMACLNATVVALCEVPTELLIPPPSPDSLTLLSGLPVCECYGLAIVRAVNPDTGVIYLTTGVSTDVLPKVNALLRGRIDLPQALFVEQPVPRAAFSRPQSAPQLRQLMYPPYLGPQHSQGAGRTAVNQRRYYPRVQHHNYHRTSDVEHTPTRHLT